MPTPTQLHPPFVTGILICVLLLTIAFHLQARAAKQAENSPAPSTPPDFTDASLQPSARGRSAWNHSLTLVVLMFAIIIGRWFTRTTYYDYFVIEALFWPLFAISVTAMLIASLTSGVLLQAIERWWSRALMLIILLALTTALGWATFTILPNAMADFTLALRDGPQLASGHLDSKNKIDGRGSSADIVVDGTHYTTFDFAWWSRLRINQTIQFVRDPDHTAAFEYTHIALTPIGAVVSICIGAVWLWMIGFVVWRFQSSIAERRRM